MKSYEACPPQRQRKSDDGTNGRGFLHWRDPSSVADDVYIYFLGGPSLRAIMGEDDMPAQQEGMSGDGTDGRRSLRWGYSSRATGMRFLEMIKFAGNNG